MSSSCDNRIPYHSASIWASVEFFCIAADLDHENYLRIVKEKGYKHQALSEEAYKMLCDVFNTQMKLDKAFIPE